MNRRGTGAVFCTLAAILYCTRTLSAAIFGSGVSTWNKGLFNNMVQYTGGATLLRLSLLCLAVGIVYLVWGEWTERDRKPAE